MFDGEIELVLHLIENIARHTDATGLSQGLEPRSHVHPVPVDVVVLNDDVANVDADAIGEPLFFGDVGVTLTDGMLDFDSTLDRLDSTRELGQNAIAHQLDDAPFTFSDLRFDQLFAMGLERGQCARLILPNEAAETNHISGQDRGEAALHAWSPWVWESSGLPRQYP